jgi:hypothetical protein
MTENIVTQIDNFLVYSIHPRGIFFRHYSRDRTPRLLITEWQLTYISVSTYWHIFVNCNWVDTRWQYTFTHKEYIEHHN